ncbi:hypothetical protein [Xenorhabdus griffiniae]|uniref:Uncharacterized protein n=1 Tax=Xenorhabdus griffiniae TaxID=351672 RepID=A0ABY9XDI1_9GAMM|nr:hypothetical protein [Xenorhabdus griffiniae]MBD1229398.1 hypothetical protein [Xenorhabdus griffiniae]MBE8589150.1 hypothetical protein [Xenorhabdus griffiniae]WMV70944.1 hypothetical protein QL128_12095 [Xenorhabdus griffiniae]WNH00620.1 hypothetical protein QL112_012100 [Xenorhabdus griffiniae]
MYISKRYGGNHHTQGGVSHFEDGWNFNHHKNQHVSVVDGLIAVIDNRGYISEFLLDRRHTEILITGYDEFRRQS